MEKEYILDAIFTAAQKNFEFSGNRFSGIVISPPLAVILRQQIEARYTGTIFGIDVYQNRHIPHNKIICFNPDGSVAAIVEVEFSSRVAEKKEV